MSDTAELVWWVFISTFLAIVVLVGGLGIAMMRAQRRVVAVQRSYMHRLIQAHEEERTRIAREVHDDAVQRLVFLGRELDMYRDSGNETPARLHQLGGIRGELEDLAHALRQLAHGLHPAALEQAGLNLALTQLADETRRLHGLNVTVDLPAEELEMSPDARLTLFRIAQESLRNVVRHAHADSVSISLSAGDGDVAMTLRDNGRGFDLAASPQRGIGLVGVQERARFAHGSARIESTPGKGTSVHVRLPHGRTES